MKFKKIFNKALKDNYIIKVKLKIDPHKYNTELEHAEGYEGFLLDENSDGTVNVFSPDLNDIVVVTVDEIEPQFDDTHLQQFKQCILPTLQYCYECTPQILKQVSNCSSIEEIETIVLQHVSKDDLIDIYRDYIFPQKNLLDIE